MYGLYHDTLASVPNAELYRVLPGRDAAADEAGGTAQRADAETGKTREGFFWDRKDFSFEDVLDFINPLHHLPIVGPIYREMSGDPIGAVPRVMGDALSGGGLLGAAVGAATALVDVGVEAATGKDMTGHHVAMLKDLRNAAHPAIPTMAHEATGPHPP